MPVLSPTTKASLIMTRRKRLFRWQASGALGATLAVLAAVPPLMATQGCSSGGDGGTAGQSGAAGGPSGGGIHGRIAVQLKEEESYTDFAAAFRDGIFPPPSDKGPLVASMSAAGCELLVPVGCDTPCDADSWCTGKDQCTPKSTVINAGPLALTGLGDGDLNLEPQGNVYAVSPTLPFPACSEGASVTVQASQFSLAGSCIAPLDVTTPPPVLASAGHSIDLAWAPPAEAGSRVQIAVEISHHGGFKGEIDCDVPDTGSFSVPEPLVTALNDLGRAGYPTISITRKSTATATQAPNVALEISSTVVLAADTGVVSCAGDQDCTADATCQPSRICQ
jgi:hypothetical protein